MWSGQIMARFTPLPCPDFIAAEDQASDEWGGEAVGEARYDRADFCQTGHLVWC
jgi:hypothetical protein